MQGLKKPPSDVEASELFLKLLEPQPTEVIDYPRKGIDGRPVDKIRISVLPQDKHDEARIKAFHHFKEKGYSAEDQKHMAMREVVGDWIAKELLASACLTAEQQLEHPETGAPIYGRVFFNSADVGKIRPHELTVLYNAYRLVQDKYGPLEREVDIDAWVERLTEGGKHFPLLSLDLPELVNLTSSLAARISTISRVLASLWSELPDTCQSALAKFCSDTDSFSEPPNESSGPTGATGKSVEIETIDAIELTKKQMAQQVLADAMDQDD